MSTVRKTRKKVPMTRVDQAWLHMEKPTNLMMITGVMMFEKPVDINKLKKVIKDRFMAYPRFRQKVMVNTTGTFWQDDADFDLDWHVRLSALPGKADKPALERFVSLMASTPLDQTKPLWQFHLVDRFDGGSALIMRIHHCYADGIALVQVLLSMTDSDDKPHKAKTLGNTWLKDDGKAVHARMGAIGRYMKMGEDLLGKGMDLYRDPSIASVVAKEGAEIARELAFALSLSDDPETVLRGRLGVRKRVAWAPPIPLEDVKAISRVFDATVNDILMACMAGALRSYMIDRGEAVDGLTIRATVPVNLRPLEHAKKLGNHFGLVFLDLPVGEPNPVQRLLRVTECMTQLKQSRQAIVAFGLLATIGMLPPAIQQLALELFSRKATTVATNVPGPQMPLYMAGVKIKEQMFWVPQTGSIGLGVSILSYNGNVHFGLIADAKLIPDPDAVIKRFIPEFEKLMYIALMEDWGAKPEKLHVRNTLI
ncbi:MAG: wax ester/triacylglycerol synthase family O-acyltransferase [Arenimonas sp.]|nr:wax ester/triacylglycerol synthase family O-acyltransferase [Arenimonas sp.]MBP6309664.1 wax ester/triacylglycerol synthase family O-acyltransferase [Arenimonas sp.]